MRIASCVIYNLVSIIYLLFGDESRYWGCLYIVNLLLFSMMLISFSLYPQLIRYSSVEIKKLERLFLKISFFNILSLSIYTISCTWANKDWILLLNPFVCSFLGLVFVIGSLYGWIKYKYEFE